LEDGFSYYSNRLWKYSLPTKSGHCGAPLFVKVGGMQRLAGIHIAGHVGDAMGYSVFLDKNDMDEAIKLHVKSCQEENLFVLEEPEVTGQVEAQYGYLKIPNLIVDRERIGKYGHQVMAIGKKPATNTKSKLMKSKLFSCLSSVIPNQKRFMPAYLRVMDNGIDPMEVAQDGYGRVEKSPRISLALLCAESYWNKVGRLPRNPNSVRPITFEEAVVPGEAWQCVRKIARSTSPGYPFNLVYKDAKKSLFGKAEEYAFDTPEWQALVQEMEFCEKQMLEGIRPVWVFMSFLKDERRPVEKAIKGKTRLVSGAPVSYTVLLRKYTLGFVDWFIQNRIKNSSAVGVNPYGEEWDAIAAQHGYLVKGDCNSKRMFAGDFSGYDKKLHYVWIQVLAQMMNWFYDDQGTDTWKIRNSLLEELAFSRHVVGDEIIEWIGSNSSGNALTPVLNSIANILMCRYVTCHIYLEHKANPEKVTDASFSRALDVLFPLNGSDKICTTVFGDDNLVSQAPGMEFPWFLPRVYGDYYMQLFGIEYTDEGKQGISEKLRSIDEVTFLKRGFKMDCVVIGANRKFLAPLELDTIIESVRWYRNSDLYLDSWSSTIVTAIRELSLHPRNVYEHYGKLICNACSRISELQNTRVPMVLPVYKIQQEETMSLEMMY
jgi:hypothetical protein